MELQQFLFRRMYFRYVFLVQYLVQRFFVPCNAQALVEYPE